MELERVHAVKNDLEQRGMGRNTGTVGVISASFLLSAIPLIGGPASYLVDKLGTKMLEPDYVGHIIALSDALIALEPTLARIDELEGAVDRIAAVIRAHPELDGHIRPIVEASAAAVLDPIELHNHGGIQEVVDIVLRDLHLEATTDRGGVSDFRGIDHVGTARFTVEPGSKQTLSGSTFTGRTPTTTSRVEHNATSVNHGVTQEYNMTCNGTTTALRTVMVTRDGESRAGMTVGRNGIEFGKKFDR